MGGFFTGGRVRCLGARGAPRCAASIRSGCPGGRLRHSPDTSHDARMRGWGQRENYATGFQTTDAAVE